MEVLWNEVIEDEVPKKNVSMIVRWDGWQRPERRYLVQVEDGERVWFHEYFAGYAEAVKNGEVALNEAIAAPEEMPT